MLKMEDHNNNKIVNRRDFLNRSLRISAGIALGGVAAYLIKDSSTEDLVWQLDPSNTQLFSRGKV